MSNFSSRRHGDDLVYALDHYGVEVKGGIVNLAHNINRLLSPADARYVRYPDRECREMTEVWARKKGLEPSQVILTNGVTQGLYLIASYFQGQRVLILEPTYSGYREAFESYDCKISVCDLGKNYDLDRLRKEDLQGVDLVVIGNPNNPTGTCQNLERLIETDAFLLVDESFGRFTKESHTLVGQIGSERLMILESLTKYQALAGIRIGAVYGSKEWIARLTRRRPPWSVNALALQALGEFIEAETSHVDEILEEERIRTSAFLTDHGFDYQMGQANFYLVFTPNERQVIGALLQRGFYVRPLENFNHPELSGFRVVLADSELNNSFLETLKEVKHEGYFNQAF